MKIGLVILTARVRNLGRVPTYDEIRNMAVEHLMFHCSPYDEAAVARLESADAAYRN